MTLDGTSFLGSFSAFLPIGGETHSRKKLLWQDRSGCVQGRRPRCSGLVLTWTPLRIRLDYVLATCCNSGPHCNFFFPHQMTFQFSIWDKFRDLENLPATNFSNLVHLVAHLLKTKSLPLSILKVCILDESIKSDENGSVIISNTSRKRTSLDSNSLGTCVYHVLDVPESSQSGLQCRRNSCTRHGYSCFAHL